MEYSITNPAVAITSDITVEAYDRICRDIRNQPKWRIDSDIDADYYDGAQMKQETIQRLKDAGIPAQDSNMIKPTINAVLGIEARSRTDYKVASDDESQDEIAEGLSAKLKEIETESRADRAMSDAYSSMMKAGVGWIEVSRETDADKYPFRVREIHRNEIFWDWSAKEPDLSDARYLRRDKWVDMQQATDTFPDHIELIQNAWNGWNSVDVYDGDNSGMARAYENEEAWSRTHDDFINRSSGLVKLSELWYRFHEQVHVMYLPDGRAIEYNEENPYHQQAVAQGLVQVQKAAMPRVRVSIWLGPHKLMDIPTPLPHKGFPYIPFWCFRKDRSRTPYGLIRDMRGPQDQFTDLNLLLYEIMNSVRVEVDNDALDLSQNTYQEMARNVNSLKSVTVLNAMRRNPNGFKVTRDFALAAQTFAQIEECKRRIEEVGGVYRAMLGQSTDAKSGIAINNLVEQGTTVLAEPNDNFRYARRICGQQLMAFAIQEMIGKPMQISVQQGARRKVVYLNREIMTPSGPVIQNDLAMAQVKVVLEDIPSTPTYRAQQQQAFAQIVQSAPPIYQAVLYPIMLELSDIPNRHEVADQLRKVGGVMGPQTPEEEQQAAMQEQKVQAIQDQLVSLELQLKQATIAKVQAEAQRIATPEQPEGNDGDEQQYSMVKLQAMEQQLKSLQQMQALQQQIGTLRQQLADKSGDLQLKSRALDIEEQKVHVDARVKGEQLVLGHIAARKTAPKPAAKPKKKAAA